MFKKIRRAGRNSLLSLVYICFFICSAVSVHFLYYLPARKRYKEANLIHGYSFILYQLQGEAIIAHLSQKNIVSTLLLIQRFFRGHPKALTKMIFQNCVSLVFQSAIELK